MVQSTPWCLEVGIALHFELLLTPAALFVQLFFVALSVFAIFIIILQVGTQNDRMGLAAMLVNFTIFCEFWTSGVGVLP